MKKLLLLLLFVSTASFAQIKIVPVYAGYPPKLATDLLVRVLPFDTNAKTCQLYWELAIVSDETREQLAEGNIQLTEAEFAAWGSDNAYIENVVLSKLALTRKPE